MTKASAQWEQDVLGPDFRAHTMELLDDDEGAVYATIIRHEPPADQIRRPVRAVLYLHGWSDYFYQRHLAEFWTAQGAAFYAVDLRKYGRSLREHQTPGYVDNLTAYDEEINAALGIIHDELGTNASVMLMGHSTGGLTGALWAERNPGRVSGLVLTSPWLELQGSSIARTVSAPAIKQLARFQPLANMPNIDQGFYARSLIEVSQGELTLNPVWQPTPSFPIRAGWLRAIITGHAAVARGLHIQEPILMLLSARSVFSPRWTDEMLSADSVLDVDAIARRTHHLGNLVTLARIDGGLHDLSMSAPQPRKNFFEQIVRWTSAYGWL